MSVYQRVISVNGMIITSVQIRGVTCGERVFNMGYNWMGGYRPEVGDLLYKDSGSFKTIPARELVDWEMTSDDTWSFQHDVEVGTPEVVVPPPPVPQSEPSVWHMRHTESGGYLSISGGMTVDTSAAMVFATAGDVFARIAEDDLTGWEPVENLPDPEIVDTIPEV